MNRLIGMAAAATLLTGCAGDTQVEEVKQMLNKGDPVLATTRVENGVTVHEYDLTRSKSIPMAFGADQVIVRTRDENDVVSFKVYRLVPR